MIKLIIIWLTEIISIKLCKHRHFSSLLLAYECIICHVKGTGDRL